MDEDVKQIKDLLGLRPVRDYPSVASFHELFDLDKWDESVWVDDEQAWFVFHEGEGAWVKAGMWLSP